MAGGEPLGAGKDHGHHVGRQPLPQLAFFRQYGRSEGERDQRQHRSEDRREASATGTEGPGNHRLRPRPAFADPRCGFIALRALEAPRTAP
jgi:hypothetical protein